MLIDHQIWFLLLRITHVLQTIYFVFTSLLHISVNRRIKIGLRAFWRERLIAYHYQLEPGLTKQRYIYSAFCFIYTLRILLMNNLTFVADIKNSHSFIFYSILHFIICLSSETSKKDIYDLHEYETFVFWITMFSIGKVILSCFYLNLKYFQPWKLFPVG